MAAGCSTRPPSRAFSHQQRPSAVLASPAPPELSGVPMSSSIDGLVSGLNTTDIISQMMSLERQPVTRLQTQQAGFDAQVSAWTDLAAKSLNLRSVAGAISDNGKLNLLLASSTDTSILSASAAT